jgi:alpha-tubulin suppressor-like RCC1 family protein
MKFSQHCFIGGLLALIVILTSPAFAQNLIRTQVVTASPSAVGQTVVITAEVDALSGGLPTGSVFFGAGATVLGTSPLSVLGAGQATLSAGVAHTCALTSNGGVKCWGYNGFGQLGDGTNITRATPVWVTGLTGGVVAVASGNSHSCALTDLGAVKCWGYNGLGQLGDGTSTDSRTPVTVSGLSSGVVAIAVGSAHSCALTTDGGVKCWGYNAQGQLGNGATGITQTPVAVGGPTTVYKALSAGGLHSCAVTDAGAVKCWGSNDHGQLGDGSVVSSSLPVTVSGLASGVTAVVAGVYHSCAVTAGALKCWGWNAAGQIGDGSQTDRLAPVQVSGLASGVVAAGAGQYDTCALLNSFAVRCWGDNTRGAVGDGTTTPRLTPTPVSNLGGLAVSLTTGFGHSCALLSPTRTLRCWGDNQFSQIGDGTSTIRLLPVSTTAFWGLLRARAQRTATLVAGWHLLRAVYNGDANHSVSFAIIPHRVQ